MLDAIYIGLALGAVMALLPEMVGRWETLTKFAKSHSRIHFPDALRLSHRRHAKREKVWVRTSGAN
jgi:hypothetical protein